MTKTETSTDSSGEIDLRAVFLTLYNRKFVILIVMAVLMFGTAIFSFLAPPVYEAECAFELRSRRQRITEGEDAILQADPGNATLVAESIKTEFFKIQSSEIRESVARRLLAAEDEAPSVAKVARNLEDSIRFSPVRGTHLFTLKARHHDPARATIIANTYLDVINGFVRESSQAASREAVAWLDEKLESQKLELARNEEAMKTFRKQRNIEILKSEKLAVDQSYMALNADLVKYETEVIMLGDMVSKMERIKGVPGSIGVLPSSTPRYEQVQSRLREYLDEQDELRSLLSKFTKIHPDVIERQRSVDVKRQLLSEEIDRALVTAKENLSLASSYVASIGRNIAGLVKKREDLQEKISLYNSDSMSFQRALEQSDVSYRGLLRRIEEAKLAADEETSVFKIISTAIAPTSPIHPRPKLYILIAGILGLGLGCVGALILNATHGCVSSAHDIERVMGCSLLGTVPKISGDEVPADAATPCEVWFQAIREPLATIRTTLMTENTMPELGGQVLLVTGFSPEVGKTMISSTLALFLARTGKRVLLIDGDLRKPAIGKQLGIDQPASSLIEVLADPLSSSVGFSCAIEKSPYENLDLICGKVLPDVFPAEVVGNGCFDKLVQWGRTVYDVVLVDSAPIGPVSDALIFSKSTDGVILVCSHHQSRYEAMHRMVRALRKSGGKVLGVVLNKYVITGIEGRLYGGYEYTQYEQ